MGTFLFLLSVIGVVRRNLTRSSIDKAGVVSIRSFFVGFSFTFFFDLIELGFVVDIVVVRVRREVVVFFFVIRPVVEVFVDVFVFLRDDGTGRTNELFSLSLELRSIDDGRLTIETVDSLFFVRAED